MQKKTKTRPADIFVNVQAHIKSGMFIRDCSLNRQDIRDFTFNGIDLSSCRHVLDLGCSYGFFIQGLAGRLHPEVHINGVDLWRGCEELFVKACTDAGYTGDFCLSDNAFCRKYPSDSFDLVLCSYALYFFPDAIPEIARIVRPGGLFITVTHTAPHMRELIDIVKLLLEKHGYSSRQELPMEELLDSFSSANGLQLLSPWFNGIAERKYENSLRIDNVSLPRLIEYLDFKKPLFFPEDASVDSRFINTVVKDYFREVLGPQDSMTISKNDTVYICRHPVKNEVERAARKKRKFCPYCGTTVEKKMEGESAREYCPACDVYFYENPLPVVSCILVDDRRVLLVKRRNRPYRGKWCLPSGFAESGESIIEAALRELEEETGIKARIVQLQDVDSCSNYFYGDLLFLTFEVEQTDGVLRAGDDAEEVRYFPFEKIPQLAFPSNGKALQAYVAGKKDYWAIVDSFTLAAGDETLAAQRRNLLSDKLVELIEENSGRIADLWMEDVQHNRSTPTYHVFDPQLLHHRVFLNMSHFGQWLSGSYHGQDIISYYTNLGRKRKGEGFSLSEVISALSLLKKHIWSFALSQGMWSRTLDIYMMLELEKRISLFFDRATFYVAKGYEE